MALFKYGDTDFLQDIQEQIRNGESILKLSHLFHSHQPVDIVCNENIFAILNSDGSLHTFGNFPEILGHSTETTKVKYLETVTIKYIKVGGAHILVVDEQMRVYGWGKNDNNQLGFVDVTLITKPKLIKYFPTQLHVSSIACGHSHSLFLLSNGTVWSTGSNEFGQLGIGQDISTSSITQLKTLVGIPFLHIAAGYFHNFALTLSGTVFGWGRNDMGQLGVGDTVNKWLPTRLSSIKRHQKVKYITAGKLHSVLLTDDGGVFTFGSNEHGQLGHGTSAGLHNVNPQKVFELMGSNVSQVACGRNHTVVLVGDKNQVYTFGENTQNQLGYEGSSKTNFLPFSLNGPWSQSCTDEKAVHFTRNSSTMEEKLDNCLNLVAGGNSSIICVSKNKLIAYESTSLRICTLSSELISTLSNAEIGNATVLRYLETLTTVMSSQSCLNTCFLSTDHEKTSPTYSGVSMMAARLGFSKLCRSKLPGIVEIISSNLSGHLISGLSSNPPDIESLRLYIFLLECPLFRQKKFYNLLTHPFSLKLLALSKKATTILDKWFRSLESTYLLSIVDTYKEMIIEVLKKPFLYSDVENVTKSSLEVMKKLHNVNMIEGQLIVPYQKFYINELSELIKLEEDYLEFVRKNDKKPIFCNYPFLLNSTIKSELLKIDAHYQMKAAFFSAQSRNVASFYRNSEAPDLEQPRLELEVKRDDIVNNTLNQLGLVRMESLKKPLMVRFQGEEGEDAGGVRKEFFMLILKEILDPKYGMFRNYTESGLMWFVDIQLESDGMYFLIGLICGLAIYNSTIIDICFPLALYRKLLGESVNLIDLRDLDPTMYNSMKILLEFEETENQSIEDVFCLTFSIDKDNYGENITVDLIPNGSNIPVNKSNREEYVQRYISHLFNDSVQRQFQAFSDGFHKVCGGNILNLFRPMELMEMVVGNQNYNWDDLEKSTDYKGIYYRQHPVIERFWVVFHRLSLEEKKQFLLFLTGSNKIPINGVKITIQSVNVDDNYLPVAHTCFNILDLPIYSSVDVLKEKLLQAIKFNQGFHLV